MSYIPLLKPRIISSHYHLFNFQIVAPACVLYFEVPDDVMVERLLGRAKTSGRVDDNEETIKKRLKTFHDHCDAVLKHYETNGLLCKVR